MRKLAVLLILLLSLTFSTSAQPDQFVQIRIVDCGQGLCCLIKTPDGKNAIYDAGSKEGGATAKILAEAAARHYLLMFVHAPKVRAGYITDVARCQYLLESVSI